MLTALTNPSLLNDASTKPIKLTHREIEIARWTALGKSAEEIAAILNISSRTVEAYLHRIKMKINTYKVTSMIYQLTKEGII